MRNTEVLTIQELAEYVDNLRELGYRLPSAEDARLAVRYHRLRDAATKVEDLISEGTAIS